MPGLTNEYVQNLGEKICEKKFLGVFCSEMKPSTPNKGEFSMIFNLDKCDGKGTHFVAIYCKQKKLYYFDSYGLPCDNREIKSYIKTISESRKCYYNASCVQSFKSIFCGFFCLSFILSQESNITPFNFIKSFKKNLDKNDSVACKIIIDSVNKKQNCK